MWIQVAYSGTDRTELAEAFKAELQALYPNHEIVVPDPLSLSVSCHIGPGALAIACTRRNSLKISSAGLDVYRAEQRQNKEGIWHNSGKMLESQCQIMKE